MNMAPLVLEYEHLEDFVPAEDVAAIRPVLREHLYEDKSAEQQAEAKLDARQKMEAAELMDSNSEATKAKLAASDGKHAREMEELSPHGLLPTMTTPVYLLHGEADNYYSIGGDAVDGERAAQQHTAGSAGQSCAFASRFG